MKDTHISEAFKAFLTEAPGHSAAWMQAVQALGQASALDEKTGELVHLALLAAQRMFSGLPFHVKRAKEAGATRAEVVSAVLAGLPVVGHGVTQALPVALAAYDEE